MNLLVPMPSQLAITLFVSISLASGCSSSSDSQSMTGADTVDPIDIVLDDDSAANGDEINDESLIDTPDMPAEDETIPADSNPVNPEPVNPEPVIPEPVIPEPVIPEPVIPEPVIPEPVTPDPVVQNRTQVNFEITVPAYQSDALQVRLTWGDTDLTASWVGDEFWSSMVELPVDTLNTLTVTFYDDNGALELARYEGEFRTGISDSETVSVTALQFDSSQFDTDQDGRSNLDELLMGDDPFIDEDALLEIRDKLVINRYAGVMVSRDLEALLSDERPIFSSTTTMPTQGITISLDIDIDESGNGTLTRNQLIGCEYKNISGIRTQSTNSITWEAERASYESSCDQQHTGSVKNTVTIVDAETRTYVEELEGKSIGTNQYRWSTSTNFTANRVAGTTMCDPVSGTMLHSFSSNNGGQFRDSLIVSKDIDDSYWRVVYENNRLTYDSGVVVSTETINSSEYFVRKLVSSLNSNEPLFICDFIGL